MTAATASNADVLRRLDDLVSGINRLRDELKLDYVRKDVMAQRDQVVDGRFDSSFREHGLLQERITALEESARWNRRAAITSFLLPLLISIIGTLVYMAAVR